MRPNFKAEERAAREALERLGGLACSTCGAFLVHTDLAAVQRWRPGPDEPWTFPGRHCEACFYRYKYNADPDATNGGTWVIVNAEGAYFSGFAVSLADPDRPFPTVGATSDWRFAYVFESRHGAVEVMRKIRRRSAQPWAVVP